MLRSRVIIRIGWAIACLLAFALASASPALAKKGKRPDPALSPPAEAAAPEPNSEKLSAGPARFFRIQDVIDAGGAPDLRLAARGDTQSDVIGLRGTIEFTGSEPFSLFAFRAPEGILWQKWRGIEAAFEVELETLARCRDDEEQCTPAARRFIALVDAAKERGGRDRLDAINRAVNEAIRYRSDAQQFGEADRWLAPLASFASGFGDCEDYVIAKYFALREAGFPLVDLRLVLVRDRKARDDHAVLAARDDGGWLILDNRHHALDHDSALRHLTPLFAINHDGVKLVAAPYVKPVPGKEAAAAPWLDGEEFALRGSIAVAPANGAGDDADLLPPI